jgi:hypothetical protein
VVRNLSNASSAKGRRAGQEVVVAAWAVAFLLAIALGTALAGTRLISHFDSDSDTDPWGRDVLRDFYNSQGAGADTNLYPNLPGVNNLRPFPLRVLPFSDAGILPGDPFEIHQFASDGSAPGFAGMAGENRFAAFGSGWSLGAQDAVEDFQVNFVSVGNEDDDANYRPGDPGLVQFLANNTVTGAVQDWSNYDDLCFYLCINIGGYEEPSNQRFWSKFKIQLWEYGVDVQGPPWVVKRNEREVWEASLDCTQTGEVLPHATGFTGWRHIRIPFSSFKKLPWDATYWRYGNFVSQEAYDAMNGTLDKGAIRAIVFRKVRIQDLDGNLSQPADRITVALDEIVVTGDTSASVLRVNVPGNVRRCQENDTQWGLSWAPLFGDDANQQRPYTLPNVRPAGPRDQLMGMPCVDVHAKDVRNWQQFWATFSAEVGNGAVVAGDANSFSSEMVFVPQFQAPGTWVERWTAGPDFLRRKGTMQIPGPPARQYLFYTDWRYDYTNGAAAEHYLVRYNPAGGTPFARLDPSAFPYGGFLANYFREFGYAYGTLFVLPRDAQGNIGRAQVIDVLFQQATPRQLRFERLMTGQP